MSSLKLKKYELTADQWDLAADVREVLLVQLSSKFLNLSLYSLFIQLFDRITYIFSQADTPLIVDVLPCLEDLRAGLTAARDDEEHDVANVVRVACHASILLLEKYLGIIEDHDIYILAIGMCYLQWHITYSFLALMEFVISYVPRSEN